MSKMVADCFTAPRFQSYPCVVIGMMQGSGAGVVATVISVRLLSTMSSAAIIFTYKWGKEEM